jgi:hypothetical protein
LRNLIITDVAVLSSVVVVEAAAAVVVLLARSSGFGFEPPVTAPPAIFLLAQRLIIN